MKKIISTIIFICLVFLSCGKKEYKPLEPISELQYLKNAKKFQEVLVRVDSINLKCSEYRVLKGVHNFKINKGRIVIWAGFNDDRIIVFDTLGNQTAVVGNRGQGPGEYTYINLMDIDENYIYVYDMSQQKITIYNYQGKYINSFKIKHYLNAMAVSNGKIFIKRSPITDKNITEDIIDVYDHTEKYLSSITVPMINNTNRYKYFSNRNLRIISNGDNILLSSCDDYSVYNYDIKNNKILYKTNYLPKWVKVLDFDDNIKSGEERRKWALKNSSLQSMYFFNNIIILHFYDNMAFSLVIYDKNGNYLTDFRTRKSMFESEGNKFYGWDKIDTEKNSDNSIIQIKIYELAKNSNSN